MIKSYTGKKASYAKGGGVLGRTTDFMKTPDRFRDSQFKKQTEDDYGGSKTGLGSGKVTAPAVKEKSLKAIKPRG
jgi:hypothetical protein